MSLTNRYRPIDLFKSPAAATLLVASPLLLFPFSRLYLLAYLLLIVAAALLHHRKELSERPIWLAVAAFALPITIPLVSQLFAGGEEWRVSITKIGLFLVAGVMAAGVKRLLSQQGVAPAVSLVLSLTILFWVFDGLFQLFAGFDLFGQPLSDLHGSGRLTAFFTQPTRFGYYIGILAAIPVFWLIIDQKRPVMALAALMATAVVTLGGGSRYSMIAVVLTGVAVLYLMLRSRGAGERLRLALSALLLLLTLLLTMYQLSPSFVDRYQDTLLALFGGDLASLNRGLSYRIDIWQAAVGIVADHPLTGIGPDQFVRHVADYQSPDSFFAIEGVSVLHTHQVLLEIAVATGFTGPLLFLLFYLWLLVKWATADPFANGIGWGANLAFLLLWLPIGTQKDFYGSEQVLISFYLLALSCNSLRPRNRSDVTAATR